MRTIMRMMMHHPDFVSSMEETEVSLRGNENEDDGGETDLLFVLRISSF